MKSRIAGLDYLRVFAAFSVVWIHSSDTNHLASEISFLNSYAVPAFILISIFLLRKKLENKAITFNNQFVRISKRVFLPYMFWTLLYLFARYIKTTILCNIEFHVSLNEIFLGGASYHLWFLPALFIWQLLAYLVIRFLPVKISCLINFALSIIVFVLGLELYYSGVFNNGFEKLFLYYSGYLFLALLIYDIHLYLKSLRLSVLIILSAGTLILAWQFKFICFTIIFNTLIFIIFLLINIKVNSFIASLSILSFGIYLSHGLFVEGSQVLAGIMNINISSFPATFFIIMLAFTAAALLSNILYRSKLLKWTIN